MASFPALFSGTVALYPLTAGLKVPVEVLKFSDFTEQRYVAGKALRRFVIHLEGIKVADRDSLLTFFESVKGGFDHTWDITVAGTTYNNMVFDTDVFSGREGADTPEHWSVTLPCRQVAP